MRESLTAVAALLVLLLTAALVGPYFVDWTKQRAIIETRLSDVAGAPVHIRGRIDLRLLPTPYFTFDQVEAGDAAGSFGLSAASMQAELALLPLLRGDIDFVEAHLQAPRLAITLAPDGSFRRAPGAPALARDLRFERLVVDGGEVTVSDPQAARTLTFSNVDFDAQADSLRGPFKADGAFALAGARTTFRVSTGAVEGGKMRLKLIVAERPGLPRLDAEGTLAFGIDRPAYAGTVALSGPLRLGSSETRWRASGAWRGDVRHAESDGVDVRLGDDEHNVSAQGPVQLSLGPTPRLSAQLRTRQVDLDRVLAGDGQPPALQRVADTLRQLLARAAAPAPGAALDLAWTSDTLLLGGEPLNDVALGLDLEADRPSFVRVDTSVPGGGRFKLDGTLETGPAAAFNGQTETSVSDLDRLMAWATPILPADRPALPFKAVTASGQIGLSAVGFAGRDLALGLDGSSLRGAVAVTRAVGVEHARLFVDVQASALDLRAVPDAASLRTTLRDVDLEIRLAAGGVRFGRVGRAAVEAGRLRLDLVKIGDTLRLRDLAVDGIDGGSLSARGAADGEHVTLDGHVDATRLDTAGALLAHFAPGPATDLFVARARTLVPLHLVWSARADLPAGGSFRLTDLTLDGTAASTRLSGQVHPAAGATQAKLLVEAPDTIGLLRQVGLPVLAITGSGPARIMLDAQGRLDAPVAATGSATMAGTTLAWLGQIDPTAATFAGSARLNGDDLAPLLQVSALALPDLAQRIPVDLSGTLALSRDGFKVDKLIGRLAGTALRGSLDATLKDGPVQVTGTLETDRIALGTLAALALGAPQAGSAGRLWSASPFGASLADPPATSVALKAGALELPGGAVAQDADLRLDIAPGLVRVRNATARFGAGKLSGALDLRRDGAQAAVEGRVRAENVAVTLPGAEGRATFALGFAGTGSTADALAASLGGSGRVQMTDLVLARADPDAIGRVAAAVDDEQIGLDPAEVTRSLRRALDAGPLSLGARSFDMGLAGGILRLTPARDTAGPPLSATINVRTGTLEARLDLPARDLPPTWTGAVPAVALVFKGALTAPVIMPSLEIGDFLNVMAERAIARDSARIQAFEFDAHERAVANARIAYGRRRDAERRKAEEDARRAAEKKAFDEEVQRAAADKGHAARDDGPEPVRRPQTPEAPVRLTPDPGASAPY